MLLATRSFNLHLYLYLLIPLNTYTYITMAVKLGLWVSRTEYIIVDES